MQGASMAQGSSAPQPARLLDSATSRVREMRDQVANLRHRAREFSDAVLGGRAEKVDNNRDNRGRVDDLPRALTLGQACDELQSEIIALSSEIDRLSLI
jgi:uncharacterized coiled-coil DUF342 family protein